MNPASSAEEKQAVLTPACLNVYMTEYSNLNGTDLNAATHNELVKGLMFINCDMGSSDYVLVGHAEVSITLLPRQEVVATQVDALRRQQGELHAKSIEIDRQINMLLAIENGVQA